MTMSKTFVYMFGGLFWSLIIFLSIAKYVPNREVFLSFGLFFAGWLVCWLDIKYNTIKKNMKKKK